MFILPVSLTIILAIVAQACNKRLLIKEEVSKITLILFFFCFVISAVFSLVIKQTISFYCPIVLISFVNATAVWFFYNAIKINLSQSIITYPLTSVVVIILSGVFLGETVLFSISRPGGWLIILGFLIILAAVLIFGKFQHSSLSLRRQWLTAILIFVLISGLVDFCIKYFAIQKIDLALYLVSWYGGMFLGSLIYKIKLKNISLRIAKENFWYYFFLIICTWGAMRSLYWALSLAPASIVFLVRNSLFIFGLAVVGLYVFKEKEKYNKAEWLGLTAGLIGAVLLILGMYI